MIPTLPAIFPTPPQLKNLYGFTECPVSEVHRINWGVFQKATLTPVSGMGQALALSHDGREGFRALICSTNL